MHILAFINSNSIYKYKLHSQSVMGSCLIVLWLSRLCLLGAQKLDSKGAQPYEVPCTKRLILGKDLLCCFPLTYGKKSLLIRGG